MPTVRPYDPEALTHLTNIAAESAQKVSRMLRRKKQRADELLGKEDVTESDLKAARALEREIELVIEVVQDYKQIIQQHEAESETRWGMIELQDKRCAELKRAADYWKNQAEENSRQFEAMRAAFQTYVERQIAAKNA
jgi:hypothetical protein